MIYDENTSARPADSQKSVLKPPVENLFFFTDNDKFRTSRYEYLKPAEDKRGFVFGLFVND